MAVKQSYAPISRTNTWGLNGDVEQSRPVRCESSSNSRRTWEEPDPWGERLWNMITSKMCMCVLWCECQCCSGRTRLSFGGVKGEMVRGGEGGDGVCVSVCQHHMHRRTHQHGEYTDCGAIQFYLEEWWHLSFSFSFFLSLYQTHTHTLSLSLSLSKYSTCL